MSDYTPSNNVNTSPTPGAGNRPRSKSVGMDTPLDRAAASRFTTTMSDDTPSNDVNASPTPGAGNRPRSKSVGMDTPLDRAAASRFAAEFPGPRGAVTWEEQTMATIATYMEKHNELFLKFEAMRLSYDETSPMMRGAKAREMVAIACEMARKARQIAAVARRAELHRSLQNANQSQLDPWAWDAKYNVLARNIFCETCCDHSDEDGICKDKFGDESNENEICK
ncbi:hypothetical protein BZA05DRAFT_421417 [Tricharina praecox]|uniref:uncharacterized protein n=1 Tax=Tricharina praecox TaxID=43433 RepID=UPI00221F5409|nr:uncharacterized protein BZA05DRAFT_421417 [Tricharina praecox]KAI5845339.1 hypothetical protein BZA05DRAFT_421417 [Tricharina praecox]